MKLNSRFRINRGTRLQPRGWAMALLCGSCLLTTGSVARAVEVVVDNRDEGFSILEGDWRSSKAGKPHGFDYLWTPTTEGPATAMVEWRIEAPAAGTYELAVWYVADPFRATNASYAIEMPGGKQSVEINQRLHGVRWVPLGTLTVQGKASLRIVLGNNAGKRSVVADAVRLRSLEPGEQAATAPADLRSADAPQTAPTEEFRGLWVTRFEWPDEDQAKSKAYIDRVMTEMARHRFNAVVFQVRGQADTFYPSPDEPWSPLISPNGADPGWDPLAYALDKAHQNGLEFHAYVNSHVAWQDDNETPPRDQRHPFYRHFNAADPATRDWLVHDENGQPVQFGADHYVWIAPGVPQAQAYTRKQIMYIVEKYDVDGIHIDRIRTAGPQFSHDPISKQRLAGEGNPAGLDFADWTRDQITRHLADLYAQIAEVKPQIKLSATPVGLYKQDRYPNYPAAFHYGYNKCYQDGQAWMAAGVLDFIVPQIYWADGGRQPNFSEILPDWVAHAAGRHVYAGQTSSVSGREVAAQIQVTREQGGHGAIGFHFGSYESRRILDLLSRPGGVYGQPAAVPPMPWKTEPSTGIIIGTITDAGTGEPIIDAQITREGHSYTALSSGDGLYSFLNVDPGRVVLKVRKQGYEPQTLPAIDVAAGRVSRLAVKLAPPGAAEPAAPPPPPAPSANAPTTPSEPAAQAAVPVVVPVQTSTSSAEPPARAPAEEPPPPAATGTSSSKLIAWTLFILLLGGVAAAVAVALFRRSANRQQ